MKNIHYEIAYNTTTKTWCVFKYIEQEYSVNFYAVFEDESRKKCQEKLNEIRKVKKDGKKDK